MMVAFSSLAVELCVAVGNGTKVGGELEKGSDGDGRNEDVALAFATERVTDSTSKRVGRSSTRNVIPNVVVCVSGRLTTSTSLIEVLSCDVIDTSPGSAVRVKLMVAFAKELVRRYSMEARKLKNIWGITLPASGMGPLVKTVAVPV